MILTPAITPCTVGELDCLKVSHPLATALIALQGAQLLEYTPAGQQPVIWLSEQAEFKQGQSVRGGIPICWPWFGDARRNPEAVQQHLPTGDLPAHGWARTRLWELTETQENAEGVAMTLQLRDQDWPAPFPKHVHLSLHLHIGSTLAIELITDNQSDETLHISQALHSYFGISDVTNTGIRNLEGVPFIDTLDHWQEKREHTPVAIDRELDRIYANTPESMVIDDAGWNRCIRIQSDRAHSAVVWNPWIEKGKRLSQFSDDAYRGMLCVESGNLLENIDTLPPKQDLHLDQKIGLEC